MFTCGLGRAPKWFFFPRPDDYTGTPTEVSDDGPQDRGEHWRPRRRSRNLKWRLFGQPAGGRLGWRGAKFRSHRRRGNGRAVDPRRRTPRSGIRRPFCGQIHANGVRRGALTRGGRRRVRCDPGRGRRSHRRVQQRGERKGRKRHCNARCAFRESSRGRRWRRTRGHSPPDERGEHDSPRDGAGNQGAAGRVAHAVRNGLRRLRVDGRRSQ